MSTVDRPNRPHAGNRSGNSKDVVSGTLLGVPKHHFGPVSLSVVTDGEDSRQLLRIQATVLGTSYLISRPSR